MGKIDIKGDVVDDMTAEWYGYWGIDSVSPKAVQMAVMSLQQAKSTRFCEPLESKLQLTSKAWQLVQLP